MVRADYVVWYSVLVVSWLAITELRLKCVNSLTLTSLLHLTALLTALVFRVASIIHSILVRPGNLFIGGFISSPQVLTYTYPAMVIASLLSINAYLIEGFAKDVSDKVISSEINCVKLVKFFEELGNYFIKHYVITAFAIGFLIRLLPELIWWPLPLGYDTVSYVAHLIDFKESPTFFGTYFWQGGFRHVPPLLDWVTYPFTYLTTATIVFKLYPPIIFGLLIALISLFSVRVLGTSRKLSLVIAFASSLNILLLRMSWDLQKQVLGVTLFFLALIILEDRESRHYSLRVLLISPVILVFSALATEFGAALTIILSAVIIARVAWHWLIKPRSELSRPLLGINPLLASVIYAGLAAFSYGLITWYLRIPAIRGNLVLGVSSPLMRVNLSEGPSVFAYVMVTYGLLTPLLFIGLRVLRRRAPNSFWVFLILIALSLTPWLTPYTALTLSQWDRLLMTASIIAIPVALAKVRVLGSRVLIAIYLLMLILPGLYAVGGPEPSTYNSVLVKSLKRMPPGLSPMPASRLEFNSLMLAGEAASKLNLSNEPIISSSFNLRFIHLYVRNPTPNELISSGWSDPTAAQLCVITHELNLSRVYVLERRANVSVLTEAFSKELSSIASELKEYPNITGLPKYCGNYPVNEAGIKLRVIYSNKLYAIYEVSIFKR